jgi:uncharacterized protein YycO
MSAALVIVYARSHTIGGLLIRHADRFGRWSHCGVVTPESTVIEARAFHGVVETEASEFYNRYPTVEFKNVVCPDPLRGVLWTRNQVGKGYDYPALAGLALRRGSWADEDRWHCSELVEAALVQAGKRRFLDAPAVISPNLSYMVI